MDRAEFDKYLKERYEDQVGWYDNSAKKMKRRYMWLQTVVIVLAALTTVAAAVGAAGQSQAASGQSTAAGGSVAGIGQWTTVVISALVTIGTSLLGTFKYKETWLNYRGTYDALKREKSHFIAQAGAYRSTDDRESLFVQHVEAILQRESAEWQSVQHLKDEEEKPESGNK